MSVDLPKVRVSSGVPSLDRLIDCFRLGDNVVWQVEDIEDYCFFARAFLCEAIAAGRTCVYIRFAAHSAVLEAQSGLEIITVDPSEGFDVFSSTVYKIIEARGREVFYVFDNLSALAVEWATDELLAAFFQVTCPFLFELDTVAIFALIRGQHADSTVARIRDTTQILLSLFYIHGKRCLHPLKVWGRYSVDMFLPHDISGNSWRPVLLDFSDSEISPFRISFPLSSRGSSIAPWDAVYQQLSQLRNLGEGLPDKSPEVRSLKNEFSRMMLGSHPSFDRLVDQFLTIDDLFAIRGRLIGSGKIGGKAAGMLVARAILAKSRKVNMSGVLELHDSFYIGSDVFFTFLIQNNLFRLRLQLTEQLHYQMDEYEDVQKKFCEGRFPPEMIEQFSRMLDYFGEAPIIVRSSSLLEDNFGNAFAGKYASEFCVNQGSHYERLDAFVRAVKTVYASALSPDALRYRHKRGLGDRDEQMAILVQRVVGFPYKHFFFPSVAGVAMSRNLYGWTPRIDSNKGLLRLVLGLGTRAVNRVGNDYPRMVAVSHPTLRPEDPSQVFRYSQKNIDLINLRANCCETLSVWEALDLDYPSLHWLVSRSRDGIVSHPLGSMLDGEKQEYVLTLNSFIEKTCFVDKMDKILTELERVYRQPVEIEFTVSLRDSGDFQLNLLQCRPMPVPEIVGSVLSLAEGTLGRRLFATSRFLGGGGLSDIDTIVYIEPQRYFALSDVSIKKSLGRVVGAINAKVGELGRRMILIGPGRWGSSNVDLGVNVTYNDIHNTAALVELAHEASGHVPEVSYGTHFFMDLVESRIMYLAVYPQDKVNGFWDDDFFERERNGLSDFLPEYANFGDVVKLIDLSECSGRKGAIITLDRESSRAGCWLIDSREHGYSG